MWIEVDEIGSDKGSADPTTTTVGVNADALSKVAPKKERGQQYDACTLTYKDGRAIVVRHSYRYIMELLGKGDGTRPGVASDVNTQLERHGVK